MAEPVYHPWPRMEPTTQWARPTRWSAKTSESAWSGKLRKRSTSKARSSTSTASSRGWTSTTASCSSRRTTRCRSWSGSSSARSGSRTWTSSSWSGSRTSQDQVEAGGDARGADGMRGDRDRRKIRERVIDQRERLARCFEGSCAPRSPSTGSGSSPVARLRRHERGARPGVRAPGLSGADAAGDRPRPPFPYISNLSLSLAVRLRDPDQDTEVLARVKVPKELLGRFLPIGDGGRRRWFRSRT